MATLTAAGTTTKTKTTTKKPRAGGQRPRSANAAPAPRVRHLGDDAYWCESRSHPGQGHHTTPDSCTCAAGRWGRTCWHLTFVRAYHAWREQQLAAKAQGSTPQGTAEREPLPRYFE